MSSTRVHIAIIGGGLCGLALAAALTHRKVPFKIYEARASFTEIGAGINLGPNAHAAFAYIEPELGSAINKMCTRNPPPKEDVWMQFRYGAPTQTHQDYDLMFELEAPPTGNMTAHRNELLQMLADRCPAENVAFNKKLLSIEQSEIDAIMIFEDGTRETASIVIACDGIHSNVRTTLRDINTEQKQPQFTSVVAYRGLLTIEQATQVFGVDNAKLGQLAVGPSAYMVKYGVAGGEHIAVGLWTYHKKPWPHKDWVLEHQHDAMRKDYKHFGPTIHRLMDAMPDPSCWATFAHTAQPERVYDGRVCLIGDAAHSMPPHQGAGAGQAMEDACVMAEVLSVLAGDGGADAVAAAFEAYDAVRTPHSQRVLEMGLDGMEFTSGIWREDLSDVDVEVFKEKALKRWHYVWDYDVAAESQRARQLVEERLGKATI